MTRAAPGRRGGGELRDHAAADGRRGPADRGFSGRPGRLVRDAAQGQRAELRAHLRFLDDPQRLRHDDRRARRPPVERGRRVVLGRAPRGAAGCVLRDRRPARDLSHGAAADGGFPGRHRRGERAQPAVPRHDDDPDGGGEARRRPRNRARGDQGARAGRGEGIVSLGLAQQLEVIFESGSEPLSAPPSSAQKSVRGSSASSWLKGRQTNAQESFGQTLFQVKLRPPRCSKIHEHALFFEKPEIQLGGGMRRFGGLQRDQKTRVE